MPTLPLNIHMHGKTALIVGGGKVALRKIHSLLAAGAEVRLVSREVSPEISGLAAEGLISVRLGNYDPTDLEQAFLVVTATNDAAVNLAVAADAVKQGILVAVTDNPTAGNCTFPALLRRGDLEISVSSGGRCPTLAADIRDVIADVINEDYGPLLEHLAAEREKLLTDGSSSTYNKQILRSLARQLILELTERKDTA